MQWVGVCYFLFIFYYLFNVYRVTHSKYPSKLNATWLLHQLV